jgi:hypothetical protein
MYFSNARLKQPRLMECSEKMRSLSGSLGCLVKSEWLSSLGDRCKGQEPCIVLALPVEDEGFVAGSWRDASTRPTNSFPLKVSEPNCYVKTL